MPPAARPIVPKTLPASIEPMWDTTVKQRKTSNVMEKTVCLTKVRAKGQAVHLSKRTNATHVHQTRLVKISREVSNARPTMVMYVCGHVFII